MANRIISRLEMRPNFDDVQFIYISGGIWNYPAQLRTPQGDVNVSAFYAKSKVALLSEVSGYKFKKAEDSYLGVGEAYCSSKQPWPHEESITINGQVAIICLKK